MSALYGESWASLAGWAPVLGVLAASIGGSAHCVGMCGGLMATCARSPRSAGAYHLGRLAGYVTLGLLAGALGERVLPLRAIGKVSAVILAAFFVVAAIRIAMGRSAPSLVPPGLLRGTQRALGWVLRRSPGEALSAFVTGGLSAFLPCGWLHTFVVAALASGSAARGALLLGVFWAGTLPAMGMTAFALRRSGAFSQRRPGLSACFLLLAALGTLWVKAGPLLGEPTKARPSCHAGLSGGD